MKRTLSLVATLLFCILSIGCSKDSIENVSQAEGETAEQEGNAEDSLLEEWEKEWTEDPLEGYDVLFPAGWGREGHYNFMGRFLEAEKTVDVSQVRMVNAQDFDGDGYEELFVFIGEEAEPEYQTYQGALWYVAAQDYCVIEDTKDKEWELIDGTLSFGDRAYAYMNEFFVTDSLSYVWGVENGWVSEPSFSRKGVITETDDKGFIMTEGAYDGFASTDMENQGMLMGHTYKPYYFYFDTEEKAIREYGAAKVWEEELEFVMGEHFNEVSINMDSIIDVLYRDNGILTINTVTPDMDGFSYDNINFDTKTGEFLDAYGTGIGTASDSNYGGTYCRCLCPEIATYPSDENVDFIRQDGNEKLAPLGLYVDWAEAEKYHIFNYKELYLTENVYRTVFFQALKPVEELTFYNLEFEDVDSEGVVTFKKTAVKTVDVLETEVPLVVGIQMFEAIPNTGFSVKGEDGEIHCFAIGESGRDGSIYVEEIP
ncbi:MAG: hypothetical protein MJ134_06665 [Lachnospiraceae bacterium]|nr:hypothetical protein [Lachnospiraceae bacterium]